MDKNYEQTRLTPEEAREDIERFNKAAESEGLPRMNEYKNLDDVQAAEDLLEEGGSYKPVESGEKILIPPEKILYPRGAGYKEWKDSVVRTIEDLSDNELEPYMKKVLEAGISQGETISSVSKTFFELLLENTSV